MAKHIDQKRGAFMIKRIIVSIAIATCGLFLASCNVTMNDTVSSENTVPSSSAQTEYYEAPETISGTRYQVGPGREYEEINDVPWLSLVAGDMVLIHARPEPYIGVIGIQARGNELAPVRIYGVSDADGNLPVISGENAIVSDQFDDFFNVYTRGQGVIVIVGSHGNIPQYIEIANLVLCRAHQLYQYTDSDGTRNYADGASGVWLKAKNVNIMGCRVYENGNGIFSQANLNDFNEISSDLLVESCVVYHNGIVNNDRRHNLYLQGVKTTVQFCTIGPLMEGSQGSAIKDRSAGTVIRYNRIESGARTIDLVEPEDTQDILMPRADFDETFVYGNILINEGSSTAMVHYGFDNSLELSRDGTLYFYNNTVYISSMQEDVWRINLFDVNIDDSRIVLYNNIIYRAGTTALNLLRQYGTVEVYGGNWISEAWYLYREGSTENPHGTLIVHDAFKVGLNPGLSAPGPEYRNFLLLENASAKGIGASLSEDLTLRYPLLYQYESGKAFTVRSGLTNSGAIEGSL
jgi:hypothetical protein